MTRRWRIRAYLRSIRPLDLHAGRGRFAPRPQGFDDPVPVQPAWLEVLEKAAVPPVQARAIVRAIEIEIAGAKETLATKQDVLILRHEIAEMRTELRTELRQQLADLRHSLELRLASTVTQPQLYGAILGQMALLLGIAYFFVSHLQHWRGVVQLNS